ncbi:MAG: hypothetical protein U5O16_02895 [Rhodococcus sp. (in: high G+C Gram-positive bacteria)]|uniref:hypothetical protein n=1 Tax=Rhodococcus sp. TaxID=1831 RepID=UPI002AD78378|nr:hypothetical protein [Rhodococcus sp. (in: high G+C Gram-positive bacteria)]
MSKTITIHYQSPASDRLKVPRPHHIQIVDGRFVVKGGELGVVDILGIGRIVGYDEESFVDPDELFDDAFNPSDFRGWFASFVSEVDGMFTYELPIDRIEVRP